MTKAKNEISVISSKKDILDIQAMKNSGVGSKQIEEMIAEAAYYKAEKRNFTNGFDVQDWLEAERDIIEETTKH